MIHLACKYSFRREFRNTTFFQANSAANLRFGQPICALFTSNHTLELPELFSRLGCVLLLQMTEPAHVAQSASAETVAPMFGQDFTGPSARRLGAQGSGGHYKAAYVGAPGEQRTWCPTRLPLLAITCSTNEPLPRIMQWIRYHQLLGFSLFYFFVEGHAQDPEVVDALRELVGVKVWLAELERSVRQRKKSISMFRGWHAAARSCMAQPV